MNREEHWDKFWILDEKGNPQSVDLMTWAKWFEKKDRIVKQEWIGDCWVSTVFLGINHNWSNKGPPILWETMVFTNYKHIDQEWTIRCAGSIEQAEAMHEEMVRNICEFEKLNYTLLRTRKEKDQNGTRAGQI